MKADDKLDAIVAEKANLLTLIDELEKLSEKATPNLDGAYPLEYCNWVLNYTDKCRNAIPQLCAAVRSRLSLEREMIEALKNARSLMEEANEVIDQYAPGFHVMRNAIEVEAKRISELLAKYEIEVKA